jgi:hypothetical protein
MLVRLSFLLVSAMLLSSAFLRVAKPAPPAGGLLVVTNQKEHTLLLVDPDNRRELAKIVVGVNGHETPASEGLGRTAAPLTSSICGSANSPPRSISASRSARTALNSGRTACFM